MNAYEIEQLINLRTNERDAAAAAVTAAEQVLSDAEVALIEAQALVPDPRKVFDVTDLLPWLAGAGYVAADCYWVLEDSEANEIVASSSAGTLIQLLEQVFGAAQVFGVTWDTSSTVSFDFGVPVLRLGIKHNETTTLIG